MTTVSQYIGGIDIGGTFTDCTLVSDDGETYIGKVQSTPGDNFKSGFFESLETAGHKAGEDPQELYDRLSRITHGTTIGTNAIVEEEGAAIGLLTTKGHEDTGRMMRGLGRATGEPPENVLKVAEIPKPEPLVEQSHVRGVPERVDSEGEIVVPMNERLLREQIQELLDKGADAFAVSYLWSFKNNSHEQRTREIIREMAPADTYVTLSSDVAPSIGEYERTTATCINSIVGPLIKQYIEEIEETLRGDRGFDGTFLLMGCNGGALTPAQAANRPVMLIGSGPVGGLNACQRMAKQEEIPNVLATDMGGTSFELGIINEGRPLVQDKTTLKKYFYDIPKLDVKSIGAGGGSIAAAARDELKLGPESAGSDPGPACYGRGGTEPTVTDANLLLGFIDPEASFGSQSLQPDREAAQEAVGELAERFGQSPVEMAAGIFQVANAKMANLIEQEVIGRGYDPREFHVISYGGAGPIHASSYARQLDTKSIVIPSEISPVWSAYGILNSDIRQELEQQLVEFEPFDTDRLTQAFESLEQEGRDLLLDEQIEESRIRFERYALMRFEGQYHDLEIEIPGGTLDESAVETVLERFKSEYSDRYSAAAVFPEARIEIVSLRVQPVGEVTKFERSSVTETDEEIPAEASKGTREVFWPDQGRQRETDVYDGFSTRPGNVISGPTIIDMNNTSIVVYKDQQIRKNRFNDFVITDEVSN